MSRYFFRWLVTSLAVFMVPHLVKGVHIDSFGSALAVAAVLGLLNVLLKPLLVVITLPLTILTLGFFILILNAFLFQLTSSVVSGFQVDSFGSAFLASIVVSLVSWVLSLSVRRQEGRTTWHVHEVSRGDSSNARDLN
jgi:putative membrane protein